MTAIVYDIFGKKHVKNDNVCQQKVTIDNNCLLLETVIRVTEARKSQY